MNSARGPPVSDRLIWDCALIISLVLDRHPQRRPRRYPRKPAFSAGSAWMSTNGCPTRMIQYVIDLAPLCSPTINGYMVCPLEANVSFSPFLCWIRIFGITFRQKTRKRRAHIDIFLGTQLVTRIHSVIIGTFTDRMHIDHLTTHLVTRTSILLQRQRRFTF